MTFGVCTDSMTLTWVIWTLLNPLNSYNGLKIPKMSKQGTAGDETCNCNDICQT